MRWESFFGPGNVPSLCWTTMPPAVRSELEPFVRLVEERAPVAMLPRASADAPLYWYIGWRTESDARFAGDLVQAFLGRTYARLGTPLQPLSPVDETERAFAEEFEGRVCKVEVAREKREAVRARLADLARAMLARPVRRARRVRPVGRILRDLEFALQAGDDATASAEIRALREGGHLDETNVTFLEFHHLALRREWNSLLAHPNLGSVLALHSVPWRVRGALLAAIFHGHLVVPVAAGEAEDALARVAGLLPAFAVAFGSRKHLVGLESDVCFSLVALIREAVHEPHWSDSLVRLEQQGLSKFVAGLRRLRARQVQVQQGVQFPDELSPVDRAQRSLGEGDLDSALESALQAPNSMARVKVLLQCATLLQDEEATLAALNSFDKLGESERASLLQLPWVRAQREALLRAGSSTTVATPSAASGAPDAVQLPTSWLLWFERLQVPEEWPGAVARASKGVQEWKVEELAGNADAIDRVVEIVESTLPPWGAETLRRGLPYVLDALVDQYEPDPRITPILCSVFDVLATDDSLSLGALSALVRVAAARLAVSTANYRPIVETISTAIAAAGVPGVVRVVTEALELLGEVPSPTNGDRAEAARAVLTPVWKWWPRLDAAQRQLLRDLADELSVSDALQANPAVEDELGETEIDWGVLATKQIALYSLSESALERAAAAIRAACPAVKLKTFAEHVGSDSMRDWARSADLFVIATRSAKHAATGAIEQHRGNRPVVYARGKGSTTLVDAVRQWLANARA